MKIAILLTGLVRDYEKNYRNFFENFINPNRLDQIQIDIFICTWDIRGLYKTVKIYIGGDEDPKSDYLSYESYDKQDIINKYNPKKILILDQKRFRRSVWTDVTRFADKYKSPDYNRVFGCLYSQFYTVKKAFELLEIYEKENNVVYDYVVRQRFDMLYQEPFLLKFINLEKRCIYVINADGPGGYKNHVYSVNKLCSMIIPIGYTDSYALCDRDTAKKYCLFYDKLEELQREDFNIETDGIEVLHVEFLLTYVMQKYYNLNYDIMENVNAHLAR